MVWPIPFTCKEKEAAADAEMGHEGNGQGSNDGHVRGQPVGWRLHICRREEEQGRGRSCLISQVVKRALCLSGLQSLF